MTKLLTINLQMKNLYEKIYTLPQLFKLVNSIIMLQRRQLIVKKWYIHEVIFISEYHYFKYYGTFLSLG